MRSKSILSVLLAFALASMLAACSSDSSAPATAPAAPTGLAAAPLGGGAHLTWTDNSSNEEMFMIMRMQVGTDAAYQQIGMVDFNTAAYHDAPLTSGKMYMYKVMAMNAAGTSDSNEITFSAP